MAREKIIRKIGYKEVIKANDVYIVTLLLDKDEFERLQKIKKIYAVDVKEVFKLGLDSYDVDESLMGATSEEEEPETEETEEESQSSRFEFF